MPYSLAADAAAAYPELYTEIVDVDGDGTAEAAESAAFDLAIAWADAKIDSYIGLKYDLPLADTPAMLKDASIDLAMFRMASTADRLTESIEKRADAVCAWLKEVSRGEASLGLSAAPNSHGPGVVLYGNDRQFTKAAWDEI